MACAGLHSLASQPLYAQLGCPGLQPSEFIYLPTVARLAGEAIRTVGLPALGAAYALVFACACLVLLAASLRARGAFMAWEPPQPWMFWAFLTGSAFSWGNVAVPLHALVFLASLAAERTLLPLAAAIVLGAWVKPLFLSYLVVLLLAQTTWRCKLPLAAATAVLGLAPAALFLATGGAEATAWRAAVVREVASVSPGDGAFGWASWLGLRAQELPAQLLWLAYAGALTAAALLFVQRTQLEARARILLGLSLAVLLNPRIMSQDLFLLGPGLAAAASAYAALAPNRPGPGRLLAATCFAVLALQLLDGSRWAGRAGDLALAVAFAWMAVVLVRRAPQALSRPAG